MGFCACFMSHQQLFVIGNPCRNFGFSFFISPIFFDRRSSFWHEKHFQYEKRLLYKHQALTITKYTQCLAQPILFLVRKKKKWFYSILRDFFFAGISVRIFFCSHMRQKIHFISQQHFWLYYSRNYFLLNLFFILLIEFVFLFILSQSRRIFFHFVVRLQIVFGQNKMLNLHCEI